MTSRNCFVKLETAVFAEHRIPFRNADVRYLFYNMFLRALRTMRCWFGKPAAKWLVLIFLKQVYRNRKMHKNRLFSKAVLISCKKRGTTCLDKTLLICAA